MVRCWSSCIDIPLPAPSKELLLLKVMSSKSQACNSHISHHWISHHFNYASALHEMSLSPWTNNIYHLYRPLSTVTSPFSMAHRNSHSRQFPIPAINSNRKIDSDISKVPPAHQPVITNGDNMIHVTARKAYRNHTEVLLFQIYMCCLIFLLSVCPNSFQIQLSFLIYRTMAVNNLICIDLQCQVQPLMLLQMFYDYSAVLVHSKLLEEDNLTSVLSTEDHYLSLA